MENAFTKRLKGRIFYGWIIVGITSLIMTIVYAIWYSFPLFYVPILEEFGWSRAETAMIFSIGSVVYGIGSAIAGALLDRFGPRKTITAATVVMVIGLVGCSQVTKIWHFFLFWGGFASLGICTAGFVPCVALVSNWFVKRRATAVGITQAGGRESFLISPLVQSMILALGWRSTYLVMALSAGVLIIGLSHFLRHSPTDMGLQPDGETEDLEEVQKPQGRMARYVVDKEWASTDWTLFKGMKQLRFWAIFSIMFSIGIGFSIVLIHQVAYVVGIGFTALFASSLLLIYGIFSMMGRLCGFVSDILGRELTYAVACGGIILGYLMLIITGTIASSWILYAYAVFFGFFSGLHSPTYASTVADIFQGKHFGAILGFANIGYGLGSAIGAWVGGYIFDTTASYVPAFAIAVISLALAWVSLWISSPRKIRRVAGKSLSSNS